MALRTRLARNARPKSKPLNAAKRVPILCNFGPEGSFADSLSSVTSDIFQEEKNDGRSQIDVETKQFSKANPLQLGVQLGLLEKRGRHGPHAVNQGDLEARLPLDQLLSCRQTHDAASHDGHVAGGRKTCSLTVQPPWRSNFQILYHFIP